jgi:phosphopantothenoylcysteine decarboxylase / phosphopantothenate---cysteine ligase
MSLKGKHILLGVSGSIAAYKSAFLTRLLVKEQAEVKVLMTESAKTFIAPITLSTLSKHPVLSDFIANDAGEWNNHVELGLWADVMLIAPATANTIAKMSNGLCDNLLNATYLSARCPVFFAPAMDLDMYLHPAVQNNIKSLIAYGNILIDAETGELASGLEGKGRMAEPEHIVEKLKEYFAV